MPTKDLFSRITGLRIGLFSVIAFLEPPILKMLCYVRVDDSQPAGPRPPINAIPSLAMDSYQQISTQILPTAHLPHICFPSYFYLSSQYIFNQDTSIPKMKNVLQGKPLRLFLFLGGFFITNALVAEFIGVKLFALEDTLGFERWNFNLFGEQGALIFSAGSILWPIVFIMTDIINEYFGVKGVRLLSFMTIALISYAFVMVFWAISLSPADFWVGVGTKDGVPDMQAAFAQIYGQSNWIIVASIIAFAIGQLVDAVVYRLIRIRMGEKMIWLRATASTAISQFLDSFVILYIAFVLGPQQWPISRLLSVGSVAFVYKLMAAIALIPLLYLVRYWINGYLGQEEAAKLRKLAVNNEK